MEGREEQIHMTMQGNKGGTQMPETLSTKLNRIAETARKDATYRFCNIAHLINLEMLGVAFEQVRKNAAAGIDGVTAEEYVVGLRENLERLHAELKEGRYRAQPLKRIYIEKDDGRQRPLSIPVLEDKIVQRAVVILLNRIYEKDFLACSYGYRPGRNPHHAVDAIRSTITFGKVNYVLDADIQDYFGSIVRSELRKMLEKRIGDENLLRLIGKWLHVGVIDDGKFLTSEVGTYQGSVISPLLANIYLHEVLDSWLEREVRPRMKGDIHLFRFADDRASRNAEGGSLM